MAKLLNEWKVWFSFKGAQQQKQTQYSQKLNQIHHIKTLQDLVYIWVESPLSSITNFFVFPQQNIFQTFMYQIDNQSLRVNSINFFKGNISPSWEDPANAQGGRLVFQINKTEENFQEIYEALVFYFLGEDYEYNETINGIRFISSNPNNANKFFFRVEIWTNFNDQQTEKVQAFRQSFIQGFLSKYKIKNLDPRFKNNKADK